MILSALTCLLYFCTMKKTDDAATCHPSVAEIGQTLMNGFCRQAVGN